MQHSEKRSEVSGDDGHFTFVNLFQGQYRIDVEKGGFKHFDRQSDCASSARHGIDVHLTVGLVSETVEVRSEPPPLQAETSSLGQVIEQRKANELPLNGRNIFNLITVSPAAVAQGGSGASPSAESLQLGQLSVGVLREPGGGIPGWSASEIGYIKLPIIIPTQDSIGEYKVQYEQPRRRVG